MSPRSLCEMLLGMSSALGQIVLFMNILMEGDKELLMKEQWTRFLGELDQAFTKLEPIQAEIDRLDGESG